MNRRSKIHLFGTLALGMALLSATSLSGFGQPTPAEPASPPAAGSDALDAILKEAESAAPADAPEPPRTIVVEPKAGDAPAAAEAPADAPADGAAPPADAAADDAAPPADAAAPAEAEAPAPAELPAPTEAEAPAPVEAPAPAPVEAAAPAADVPVPTDPIAKAAFDVLDKHCARCHQDGKLGNRLKPAKNFGSILILDQLATDPHYIAPGNPDGSKILQQILNKEMPYDVYYEADLTHDSPTEDEVLALRTWITSLGEARAAACTDRKFITPVDMATAMASDLETLQPTRVADTRYITLTHLYNACINESDMEVYRQAAVKLLNSLSRVSDVLKIETVDEYKTIIRLNLKDLGWESEDWETIIASYPYGAKPDSKMYDLLTSTTLTQIPYIRGDWFAFTASQAPLYDKLLKLPVTFAELETTLGFTVKGNLERFIAKRAGFQKSGVSRNNRLIERHIINTGYLWTSYDFAGNKDKQSLFEFPLGPGSSEFDFAHDGGETIYTLPNGFQAYYLNDKDGKQLLKGPTSIVLDPSRRDQAVTNGISCMGCHDLGMRKAKDEVRPHIFADRTFPKSVRDAVEALYPTTEEMDKIIDADAAKFYAALQSAGIDPTLKLNGVEMINALAKRYEDDVELSLAAAEFGQPQEEFLESLDGAAEASATHLKRRLEQGLIPRDTFEGEFAELLDNVTDLEVVKVAAAGAAPEVAKATRPLADSRTFDLSVTSDRSEYAVNDLPIFTVTTAQDCFLTLINVDGKGVATVLYPNKFEKANNLKAGQDFKFPAETAPYQFRFADPGTESVIAICSIKDQPVDTIKLDASRDFTDLGDYTEFLTRSIKVEGKAPVEAGGKKATPDDLLARVAIKLAVQ